MFLFTLSLSSCSAKQKVQLRLMGGGCMKGQVIITGVTIHPHGSLNMWNKCYGGTSNNGHSILNHKFQLQRSFEDTAVPNFMAIHPIVVEPFQSVGPTSTSCWPGQNSPWHLNGPYCFSWKNRKPVAGGGPDKVGLNWQQMKICTIRGSLTYLVSSCPTSKLSKLPGFDVESRGKHDNHVNYQSKFFLHCAKKSCENLWTVIECTIRPVITASSPSASLEVVPIISHYIKIMH